MDLEEWCALVHVDVRRPNIEPAEKALAIVAEGAHESDGTIDIAVLKDENRGNHFEIIRRYRSETAYHEHQISPSNLAFRSAIGPLLGSPYEDRLHVARQSQSWPSAGIGDYVVVTEVEARLDQIEKAATAFDTVVAEQASCEGLIGQVALQRRGLSSGLELVSAWRSPEPFAASLTEGATSHARAALEESLLAPIENRRFLVLFGRLTTP